MMLLISELGGYGRNRHPSRIQIIQKIPHKDEINRARYMPQNPDLIATKATSGSIYIFDRTKHASEPPAGKENVCKPDMELVGQNREGWVHANLRCCFRGFVVVDIACVRFEALA